MVFFKTFFFHELNFVDFQIEYEVLVFTIFFNFLMFVF